MSCQLNKWNLALLLTTTLHQLQQSNNKDGNFMLLEYQIIHFLHFLCLLYNHITSPSSLHLFQDREYVWLGDDIQEILNYEIQIYQRNFDLWRLGWISISWVTEFFVNLSSESSQSKCSNFFLSKIIILLASSQIWPPGTFLSRSSNFTSSLKGNWEFCDPKSYNSRLKVTWERKVILVWYFEFQTQL